MKFLLTLLVTLLVLPVAGQYNYDAKYYFDTSPSFNGHNNSIFNDIAETSNHHFVVAGRYKYDFPLVMQCDQTGNIDWQICPVDTNVEYGQLYCVEQLHDGSIISGGRIGNGPYIAMLVKITSAGNIVWTKKLNLLSGPYSSIRDIIVCPDGNLILLGYLEFNSAAGPQHTSALVMKADTSGNVLWERRCDAVNPQSFLLMPDGKILVIGYGEQNIIQYSRILEIDSNTGQFDSWKDYLFNSINYASDGVVLSNGDRLFVGGNIDAQVFKTDSSGNLLWCKKYPLQQSISIAKSVLIDLDSNIVIAGETSRTKELQSGASSFLLKIDSDGKQIWADSIGITGRRNLTKVMLTSTGEYRIAGSQYLGINAFAGYVGVCSRSGVNPCLASGIDTTSTITSGTVTVITDTGKVDTFAFVPFSESFVQPQHLFSQGCSNVSVVPTPQKETPFSINPVLNNGNATFSYNFPAGGALEIYNSLGQIVYRKEYEAGSATVPLDLIILRSGLYYWRALEGNIKLAGDKLIIVR